MYILQVDLAIMVPLSSLNVKYYCKLCIYGDFKDINLGDKLNGLTYVNHVEIIS